MVIQIIIGGSRFGGVNSGKVIKTETHSKQSVLGGFCFVYIIQFFKDAVVFPKTVIDVPNQVFVVFIKRIIVRIATCIAAEFFIGAPNDSITTFWTGFFHILKIGLLKNKHQISSTKFQINPKKT